MKRKYLIYTDGACSGNPGPGGWGAVIASPDAQVTELAGFQDRTTNNRMEISAAIAALREIAGKPGEADIFTDSTYLISGITKWIFGWKKMDWQRIDGSAILNRDLWEELDALVHDRSGRVTWNYVRGHQGHPGNSRCDEMSVAFAKKKPCGLYRGPRNAYCIDLTPPHPEKLPEIRASLKGARKAQPVWYVSLLEGRLERHKTWDECKSRVSGKSRVLFKKVSSPEEESRILRQWGVA